MGLSDWIKGVFDAPSRRRDVDYSREISQDAIVGVVLLYRDYLDPDGDGYGFSDGYKERWMAGVVRELGHLHHAFAGVRQHEGFHAIVQFLSENPSTLTFLDFLEVSLRHGYAPNMDNDFVDAVNRVLNEYGSPYLLTRFVRRETIETDEYGRERRNVHFDSFPRAYLKHDTVVQKQAIEPALEMFSDPAYATAAEDFRTALERQRSGDYDGCITSCAAAVEGTIKIVAARNRWKVRGTGLDSFAQSFFSKSSLPDSTWTSCRPLSDWRNTRADAHGHASKAETTESVARHFVALAASLIALVQSEARK